MPEIFQTIPMRRHSHSLCVDWLLEQYHCHLNSIEKFEPQNLRRPCKISPISATSTLKCLVLKRSHGYEYLGPILAIVPMWTLHWCYLPEIINKQQNIDYVESLTKTKFFIKMSCQFWHWIHTGNWNSPKTILFWRAAINKFDDDSYGEISKQ